MIDRDVLERLKARYPQGTKVRLVHMDDLQAPPVGTVGTVHCVDAIGTIHIFWENGSSLGAVYGEDIVEIV